MNRRISPRQKICGAINGNLDGDYVLDGDIDLTDYLGGGSWTPIGTENVPFTGTFDGNGHSITGLYINASDSNYQGLFWVCRS